MYHRLIAPEWLLEESPEKNKVLEGDFTAEQVSDFNSMGYNVYWLPNYPSVKIEGPVDGTHIDCWDWVYVDMDLKDGVYLSKEHFAETLNINKDLLPTQVVDSGNGIHAYWLVSDLDAMSYLKLCRRLMRLFKTDERVGKLFQLMRWPNTINTKIKDKPLQCHTIQSNSVEYTCEKLDTILPRLLPEDEEFCTRHFNSIYKIKAQVKVSEKLPLKFKKLMRESKEVARIFSGDVDDRSEQDYRLVHILNAEGFTKQEAYSVLINVPKALERSEVHRVGYAVNVVDKVYKYEDSPEDRPLMSNSVSSILRRGEVVHGTRLPCHPMFDGTDRGFRLTEVLGLVGGSGSGKTTLALNYFWHFVKRNPDFIHLFVSLEQPEEEIALRWQQICDGDESLYEKVHVLGNEEPDGTTRRLSLSDIQEYVGVLEKSLRCKVGCVVIDHIGVLDKKTKDGENQGLMDICHQMKNFAKKTKTFLVMQSQTNRVKAGIGDLELDKDSAYGTTLFEWYVDYLVTTWQPLKRVYDTNPEMCCSAYKYCKIRKKNIKKDNIKEDVVYALMFDVDTERLRLMTEEEKIKYDTLNKKASLLRNKDKKLEASRISNHTWVGNESNS